MERNKVVGHGIKIERGYPTYHVDHFEGWVYYINEGDGRTLHRTKIDQKGWQKLTDDAVRWFHHLGERISYRNEYGEHYEIRIDGTKRRLKEVKQ